MTKNRICFVAGRSGGHLIPALTLAAQEKKNNPSTEILFFSANTQLDKKITNASHAIDLHIPLKLENIPGKKIHRYPIFFWNFLHSFFSALHHLKTKKPNKIISTGGYITLPVACAAKRLRIPLHLYELNVIPGKTTKCLAPWAKKIHTCLKKTEQFFPKDKCVLTPYPNRFADTQVKQPEKILNELNFCPTKKTMLVLGGSQGSLFLNKLIGDWTQKNLALKNKIQLIHQTGATDKTDWAAEYKKLGIQAKVFDFCGNIQDFYLIADLVICRSGAGSLFETLYFKKRCITVPLETKQNNHQLYNAQAMEQNYPDFFSVVRQTDGQEVFSKKVARFLI